MAENLPRITTSRALAKLAGVSHMTVSRAFRNDPRVLPSTKERIFALAAKHGYRPNPVISLAMQAKRKSPPTETMGTLAFVHSNQHEDSWRILPHLKSYLQGIRAQARELGFSVDEFWVHGVSTARLTQILLSRGIQGVVIAPPPGFVRRMHFDWKRFCCVTFLHDSWRPLLHRVATDDLHKISVILRECRRLGYGKIGLALPRKWDARAGFVFSGRFYVDQANSPVKLRVPPLLYSLPDLPQAEAEFLKWVKRHEPECIICSHFQTIDILKKAGYRVPEDLGVVHLEIGPDVANWTGYVVDHEAIGAATVDILMNRMVRNETGIPPQPREVLLRGQWQKGTTTRRLKK